MQFTRLLKARRFIAFEMRVVDEKEKALQTLRFPKHMFGNPLSFRSQILNEAMQSTDNVHADEFIILHLHQVSASCFGEGLKFCCRVTALVVEDSHLESLMLLHKE